MNDIERFSALLGFEEFAPYRTQQQVHKVYRKADSRGGVNYRNFGHGHPLLLPLNATVEKYDAAHTEHHIDKCDKSGIDRRHDFRHKFHGTAPSS